MIYIAYGSNLNQEQMKYRCPKARYLGPAVLNNYKLEFKVHLTVTPSEGDCVPVGLWQIEDLREWKMLDRYEGLPTYYRKTTIEVVDDKGRVRTGLIYLMNNVYKNLHVPTDSYYQICADGYRDCKFDISFLEKALKCAQEEAMKYAK